MSTEFQTYRATRGFHIGEISKVKPGTQANISEGETIEFDGEYCIFRGDKYRTPGLRSAIDFDWLVEQNAEYTKPVKPVVRDEVSRPLKSDWSEPNVLGEGSLDDYNFKAHWSKKQAMLDKISDLSVLDQILSKEKGKMKDRTEERIAEVQSEIQKTQRNSILMPKEFEADDVEGLVKSLGEEVKEYTPEEKAKVFQSPQGKKMRKSMKREAFEQNEMPKANSKKKETSKKEIKIQRNQDMIEGVANDQRPVKKDNPRKNRKTSGSKKSD